MSLPAANYIIRGKKLMTAGRGERNFHEMSVQKPGKPTMERSAFYRIRVEGSLSPDWAGQLGNMNITESRNVGSDIETTLEGRLPDQAALTGILNTLYDLRLPVTSVDCLESE